MSATNRGAERRESDYYPTPTWVTRRILEALNLAHGKTYLEPCAGDGAIVRVLRERDAEAGIIALEIHGEGDIPGADATVRCDALSCAWPKADVVIMNPPFLHAAQFVSRALVAAPLVICLERVGWAVTWGKTGAPMPSGAFFLPNRPSFTGEGTDASEYAWFVWGGPPGLHMLPDTPLAERKADRP